MVSSDRQRDLPPDPLPLLAAGPLMARRRNIWAFALVYALPNLGMSFDRFAWIKRALSVPSQALTTHRNSEII